MRLIECMLILVLAMCGAAGAAAANKAHPAALHVMDFGAKGDGKTDDTAAIQKAIDAASAVGGTQVTLPRGNFLIRGHLEVKEHVVLKGVFAAPTARTQMLGTTLLAVESKGGLEGEPFITLRSNGTLKGLTVFYLSLIHISEPTRLLSISYAVFCLKKKNITFSPSRHQLNLTTS